MNLTKQRGPDVHEPKIKTILRITPKPDKVDIIDRSGVTDNAEMTTIDYLQEDHV